MTLLIVLLALLAAWILAFIGVPLVVWTLGAAALAATLWLAGSIGQTSFTIVAGVIAVLGLLLNILPLRRALLTRFVFSVFKKVLPEMSSTEREVLVSGDVWWEAEMFRGRPDWERSEERRGGNECVSTGRYWWWTYH